MSLDFSAVGQFPDEFKWRAVRDVLEQGIMSAEPRTRIPSEKYIGQRAGCAERTVRKAIHDLRERGLLYTVPGLGSFVSARE